jgi:hypothetical protein
MTEHRKLAAILAADARQVVKEPGVRCVLEGGVRKAGNRLRLTGQLIDTATGGRLWADRFDLEETRTALAKFLALWPGATVATLRQRLPFRNGPSLDTILDGLRKAGLPE